MSSLQPFLYDTLTLIHILSFAIWFGLVVASLIVIKVFEPKLTDPNIDAETYAGFLKSYIKGETKFIDIFFPLVIVSGILLAMFFTGWNNWVIIKIILVILQFAATMGFIFGVIRKITYPCDKRMYKNWYYLMGVSITFFSVTLIFVYFGR